MARKKQVSKVPDPPPPAAADPRQKNILSLRGTEEWKVWLDDLAKLMGFPVTVTIDHALRELADSRGHRKPPRRTP